jgi:FkbM family methyltransferase
VFIKNIYEPALMRFIQKYIRSGDFVVDVRAHVGILTHMFSHAVGVDGKVYAFEPIVEKFGTLCKNAFELGNVIPVCAAVGSEPGFVHISHFGLHHSGLDSVDGLYFRENIGFIGSPPVGQKRSVPVVSLDHYTSELESIQN